MVSGGYRREERRSDYVALRETLSEIKESLNQIVSWKESVIERLVKIEENFKSFSSWKGEKSKGCFVCESKITQLEQQMTGLQFLQGKETTKTNILFEVLKYIMIAGIGAMFTWLVSKL